MIRTNLVMNTMCSLQSEWHALFRFVILYSHEKSYIRYASSHVIGNFKIQVTELYDYSFENRLGKNLVLLI